MLHPHTAFLSLLDASTSSQRLMFMGESGTGKSTSAASAAAHLASFGSATYLIHSDPGRALEGCAPGSIALARWHEEEEAWRVLDTRTLASMDCLRFRMNLLTAFIDLARQLPQDAHCILDTPGITRGQIAAELLSALAHIFRPTRLFHLTSNLERATQLPITATLHAHGISPYYISPHPMAKRPSKSSIRAQRIERWEAYISPNAVQTKAARADIAIHGIIELDEPLAQPHFAIAQASTGEVTGLVLIEALSPTHITFLHQPELEVRSIATLYVRDMIMQEAGLITTLTTEEHVARTRNRHTTEEPALAFTPREQAIYRINFAGSPHGSGQSIRATVVGHLFEDPMIVLRLDHRQRCFFLDLGEVRQVPTRMIHQTTDIFLSHAHLDHFGDFPWLLRRMAGHEQAMRIYGPPGLITRVEHMVNAFTWDRVGDRGPRFEVHEIHPDRIARAHVQAGHPGIKTLPDEPRQPGDLIRQEPRQTVRAITLDHGGLESIAYSIEEHTRFGVKGNIVRAHGWTPGPWLGTLKSLASERRFDALVSWIDEEGVTHEHTVRALHDAILIAQPGQKIVYATDFSTSDENRDALVAFAQGADVLCCEASFAEEDRAQAERTGHMCARNVGELARAANVGLLVPFHLSVRYESRPEVVYAEILEVFERVLIPREITRRMVTSRGEEE